MSNKKTRLSNEDIDKVINTLQEGLNKAKLRADTDDRYAHSIALGMLEASSETAIKQLKGEWPIF